VKARLYDAGARRSRSLEADRSTLLAEAQGRVLASDGRLLFLEHVRAEEGSRLARWQDRLNPAWRAFAGCDCNRRTVDALARVFRLEVRSARFAPPFAHPVVAGIARSLS
jgi:hypothetical protein